VPKAARGGQVEEAPTRLGIGFDMGRGCFGDVSGRRKVEFLSLEMSRKELVVLTLKWPSDESVAGKRRLEYMI
jgi:hypothetical protein